MGPVKILFITATRLGDAILSTGLLDYMLRAWPEGRVTVACGSLPSSIFEGFPNVVKIIPITKKPMNGHWVDLWKQTVGTNWDVVVDMRNSAVSRLIFAKKRYVFGARKGEALHKVEQAAYLMKLSEPPSPKLHFTDAQKKFGKDLVPEFGGMVLAVGPSANWIGKTWPAAHYIEVIKKLTATDGLMPGARVAVFAAPGEEDQARPVLESVPPNRRIDRIANGNPAEVGAAITRCPGRSTTWESWHAPAPRPSGCCRCTGTSNVWRRICAQARGHASKSPTRHRRSSCSRTCASPSLRGAFCWMP